MSAPHLYHEVHGSRGPFLLLVHGMLSSRAQWMLNIEAFSAFCRPVVVELFGHGRSPTPDGAGAYSPERYVADPGVDPRYPDGYVRYYDSSGLPIDEFGKQGSQSSPHFDLTKCNKVLPPEGWPPA